MTTTSKLHKPIMVSEIVEFLQPQGRTIVDGTFGEGGHSEAFLAAGASQVIGIDRDPETFQRYLVSGAAREDARLSLVSGRFSDMETLTEGKGPIGGVLLDLGVSTRQLLTPERGFSFAAEGPLDMRMDTENDQTLEEKLADITEPELADALRENADLNDAMPIARRVLRAFHAGQLKTTRDLAEAVAPGSGKREGRSHGATAGFLALRMFVNDEFSQAREGILAAMRLLPVGGRLAVLTFHSTEDRLVKRLFLRSMGRCVCELHPCRCPTVPPGKVLTKKPLEAAEEELRANPRARSAKLRCVEKAG